MIADLAPATELDNPGWLRRPAPKTVLTSLEQAGYTARAVGGCVRDALLGREVGDIDIATDARPETASAILESAGMKVVPTGIDHGTVTAVLEGEPVEVTTLRTDVETHGRHATVAFTADWIADAERRDFTVNALYAGLDGRVYDPVGGWPDLQARRIRFIGDAEARIQEDALRILRFFRFFAWFGQPPPDEEAMAACRGRRDDLKNLSAERIQTELLKLLAAPDPLAALEAMDEAAVMAVLFPGGVNFDLLRSVVFWENALDESDSIRRLAALIDGGSGPMEDYAEYLRLSNRDGRRLASLARPRPHISLPLSEAEMRFNIYRWGRERFLDFVILSAAAAPADKDALKTAAHGIREIDVPQFPVQGRDVIQAGIEPGPAVGRVLKRLEDWWISADFPQDQGTLRTQLSRLVAEEKEVGRKRGGRHGRRSAPDPATDNEI